MEVVNSNRRPRKVVPVKIGLISDPAALVLLYDQQEGDTFKRRKRKIPLRQFTDKSNVDKSAQNVMLRHEAYMSNVPLIVIVKMLRIMQEIIKGYDPEEAAVKVHKEYDINPNEDLNKLPTDALEKRKMIMEESFVKSLLRPDDPGYKYDKEVDFTALQTVKSGWDEDDDDQEQGSENKNNNPDPDMPETIETTTHFKSDDEDDFW